MLVPLSTLQTEAKELGSAVAFAQSYPEWGLLVVTPLVCEERANDAPTTHIEWITETRSFNRARLVPGEVPEDGWPDEWIAWLRPLSKGAMVLTLGRAPASDLRIDHPSVSVLHLILTEGGEDHWQVCDQLSSNGTTLNGSELPKGAFTAARSGDELKIGSLIQATLLSPQALYDVLMSRP